MKLKPLHRGQEKVNYMTVTEVKALFSSFLQTGMNPPIYAYYKYVNIS